MLKYWNTDIVFQEIPDETTLAINLTSCPCHCPGCHSNYLGQDIGKPLDITEIGCLMSVYGKSITCICFMGGDAAPAEVQKLADDIKQRYPHYKVAWYSGRQYLPHEIDKKHFDYIKLGPYIAHLGPLSSAKTNQRMLKKQQDGSFSDITAGFWKKNAAKQEAVTK